MPSRVRFVALPSVRADMLNASAGNLLTQYALAFVGLSVTETVESSITVVMGALHGLPTSCPVPHELQQCVACLHHVS